jgi:hypothetical protein
MRESSEQDQINQFIGGLLFGHRLSRGLRAYAMEGWIRFQEQKMYEVLGYENFNAFLNNSPSSPMSKSRFYEQKKLFLKEGAPLFDILNGSHIPERKRKMLREGQVEIEGNKVLIKKDQDDEVTEIELTDQVTLIETVTELADQNIIQKNKLQEKQKFIERAEKKFEAINKEKRDARHKEALKLDSYASALVNWVSASNLLVKEIAKLPPEHLKTAASKARHKFETVKTNLARLYDPDDPNDIKSGLEKVSIDPQEEGIIQAMRGNKNEIIH